jgi:hypothetical protein
VWCRERLPPLQNSPSPARSLPAISCLTCGYIPQTPAGCSKCDSDEQAHGGLHMCRLAGPPVTTSGSAAHCSGVTYPRSRKYDTSSENLPLPHRWRTSLQTERHRGLMDAWAHGLKDVEPHMHMCLFASWQCVCAHVHVCKQAVPLCRCACADAGCAVCASGAEHVCKCGAEHAAAPGGLQVRRHVFF